MIGLGGAMLERYDKGLVSIHAPQGRERGEVRNDSGSADTPVRVPDPHRLCEDGRLVSLP